MGYRRWQEGGVSGFWRGLGIHEGTKVHQLQELVLQSDKIDCIGDNHGSC